MKKILIIADLEGIIGMIGPRSHKSPGQLMMDQVILAAECIFDVEGNCLIEICDAHNDGQLLRGMKCTHPNVSFLYGIDELKNCGWDYAYCILLGFHAMANSGGVWDHTFRNDILHIWREGKDEYIGEVTALILWANSKAVPVALVSGEGPFAHEADAFSIPTYIINTRTISEQYAALRQAIRSGISCIKNVGYYVDEFKICVEVNNADKLILLSEKGYVVADGAVQFAGVEAFFNELYRFAADLNQANREIIYTNTEFARMLKKMDAQQDSLRELSEILHKPLPLLDAADRNLIRRRMNLCEN